jgi:osmotically-inducible protein OsmY
MRRARACASCAGSWPITQEQAFAEASGPNALRRMTPTWHWAVRRCTSEKKWFMLGRAMKYSFKALRICAIAGAVVYGSIATASAESVGVAADDQLQYRVETALHADRYFFDRHVEVSVNNGVVVLRGLVFSDWDLRDALRIARKAAGDNQVVNSLTIVQGGRR